MMTLLGAREDHATSTHAQREWTRIVLQGAADILNALAAGRPSAWADLFARLSDGYRRAPAQRLRVLSMIAGGDTTMLEPATLEIRARRLIRFQAREMFLNRIGHLRNGSQCALTANVVDRDASGKYVLTNRLLGREHCRKNEGVCAQREDLEFKKERLRAASEALVRSASESHQKDGKAGLRAAIDPASRTGQNCYQKLGDLSIALECQADEVLLTTDSSFEVMAPVLGLTVRKLSSTKLS